MTTHSPAAKLREILDHPGLEIMPCCFDALSARMIEQAGFSLTFMSGFAVSASRLGAPDTGIISYGEMVDQGRNICAAVSIPIIGDGDTGYGSPINVKHTVRGYARAGFAAIMIEDQVWPKRCGHTQGKRVVPKDHAMARIQAAVDARDEGADILIMARTDARATHGIAEAIDRAKAFADLGADISFLEAPLSEDEMLTYCQTVPGPKMANMLEQGRTPVLPPDRLEAIGFKLAAYPLTLMSVAMKAMQDALTALRDGVTPKGLMDFAEIRNIVGFPHYDAENARYAVPD